MTVALMFYARVLGQAGAVRWLGDCCSVHALLVYAFLYAPILVVVVLAFNGGRQVLYWEGFSTKWFGAALRNPDIRDALQTSLVVAALNAVVACVLGTLLALALSRMRAVDPCSDRRARVHDPRHAGDRLRNRRA